MTIKASFIKLSGETYCDDIVANDKTDLTNKLNQLLFLINSCLNPIRRWHLQVHRRIYEDIQQS